MNSSSPSSKKRWNMVWWEPTQNLRNKWQERYEGYGFPSPYWWRRSNLPFLPWRYGHSTSVNGVCYLSLSQNTVWTKLRYTATRYFFSGVCKMALHFTNAVPACLNEKFRGQVISQRIANLLPAHILGIKSLDFHFLAVAKNQGKTYIYQLSSL